MYLKYTSKGHWQWLTLYGTLYPGLSQASMGIGGSHLADDSDSQSRPRERMSHDLWRTATRCSGCRGIRQVVSALRKWLLRQSLRGLSGFSGQTFVHLGRGANRFPSSWLQEHSRYRGFEHSWLLIPEILLRLPARKPHLQWNLKPNST